MARVARQCTKCGSVDVQRTWASNEEAVKEDLEHGGPCPSCAWPEAGLVEAEPEAARSWASPMTAHERELPGSTASIGAG